MVLVKQKATQRITRRKQEKEAHDANPVADLEDADPAIRRSAARALVHCPDAADALLSRLRREENFAVREVILTSLIRIGASSVASELAELLRTGDAAMCNEIIEAMKQMPGEVAPMVRSLLADSDPDMRIFAVNILESLRHPEIESWLI